MRLARLASAEVARFVASRRGLVTAIGFALVWWVVLWYVVRPAGTLGENGTGLADLMLDAVGLGALANWPAPELAAWWVTTLYGLPVVAVLASADQISSDRARGTLRYLVLRATRLEILLGRFCGQCMVQAIAVAATLISVLVLVALADASRIGESRLVETLAFAPSAGIAVWLTLLPWVALMTLVSSIADTPRRATLYATILWVLLSILTGWLQRRFGDLGTLDYLLPGSQVRAMIVERSTPALALASIGLAHAALFLAAAGLVMRQRDL